MDLLWGVQMRQSWKLPGQHVFAHHGSMEPGPSMLLVPFYHDTSRLRPGHMWEDSVTSCLWPGCDHLEPKQRCRRAASLLATLISHVGMTRRGSSLLVTSEDWQGTQQGGNFPPCHVIFTSVWREYSLLVISRPFRCDEGGESLVVSYSFCLDSVKSCI